MFTASCRFVVPIARLLGLLAVLMSVSPGELRAAGNEQVDRLVQPLIEAEAIVGCVVGIVDGDRTEVHAYGRIRRESEERPDGNTIYEIGSITKAFTGTLLADMAGRKLVDLDASLQDYMPEDVKLQFAEEQPIKLADLASQTSGLPRLPGNFRPKDWKNPYADYTDELLYDFLRSHKLRRPPGKYEYSNLGAGLLGNLLARRAGSSYEQLVIERICEPLQMADTRITLSEEQRTRLAPPYNGELREDNNWDCNALAGAGDLCSTVNDMLKLIAASFRDDDAPVSKAIHDAWQHRYGKPGGAGVGLCWHIAHDGVTRWHNGMTGGYSSMLLIRQPERKGVIVLANTTSDTIDQVARQILQARLGMNVEPISIRKAVTVAPDILGQYAGTYLLSPFFAITVTLEDGKLMAQATGQDKYQIFPESETKFFYKVVDAQISFEKNDQGKVTKLILHQNKLDQPGIKVK